MGLDMYLRAHRYLSSHDETEKALSEKAAALVGFESPFEVRTVSALAQYWRKANAIHRWFVMNVQSGVDDCREYDVNREDIDALIALCDRALETRESSFLPPKDGFFFGSTEIDEYYWNDLKQTRDGLRVVLEKLPPGCWLTYQSSW